MRVSCAVTWGSSRLCFCLFLHLSKRLCRHLEDSLEAQTALLRVVVEALDAPLLDRGADARKCAVGRYLGTLRKERLPGLLTGAEVSYVREVSEVDLDRKSVV